MRHLPTARRVALAATAALLPLAAAAAQDASDGQIVVTATGAYDSQPSFAAPRADLGPLGDRDVLTVPASITTVPESLILNVQARTVNDTLRALPSVQIRNQQGLEVSRPQSRGFQSSIAQDTRLDGLNVVGTTAIAAENLGAIQVLNGQSGALYGPQSPAGVFDYQLKRPTAAPLLRVIGTYDAQGLLTGWVDVSERAGPVAVRVNALHGAGESFVDGSHANRTLGSVDADVHIDSRTVFELDGSYYRTQAYGLPGSIVYFNPQSVLLPPAVDAARRGYGQPGAGTDLETETGLGKLRHDLGSGWRLTLGALYQNANRGLYGITNTLTDNRGDYTVTKNFNAVSRFAILSDAGTVTGTAVLLGLRNDLAIGTNGFILNQYNNRNSIAVTLGRSNLADPAVLPTRATPATGSEYRSGRLQIQSIVTGDTLHVTDTIAVQAVLSTSWLRSVSFNTAGRVTSQDRRDAVLSPTVSLVYTPRPDLTFYATYANNIEQGETAPAGTANANQTLSPYRDEEYEAGIKWRPLPRFLVTAAGFRMTRPLAQTTAATNLFTVVGTQRNWGGELFGQGDVSPALSLLGGVTYLDARLEDAVIAGTDDGRVVGVPRWKSDMTADFHPAFAGGFALTGTVHHESDRAATNLGNSDAPPFTTVDLGLRYAAHCFGHGEVARINVVNVGDKRYFSSIADGNIVGSPGANTAYPGAPRTVLASLEFDL